MHTVSEIKDIQNALQKTPPDYCALPDIDADFAYALHIKSDGTLIIEWVTEAFSHITGYDPQDIVVSDILSKLIHPDDIQQAKAHLNTLLDGQPHVNEFRIITRDGALRWLRDHGQPIWDEAKGQVVRIYGKTQDITAQKEASEALWQSEKYFHRLIESGIHLIAVLAGDGTILYANSHFERALGYTCRAIVNQNLFEFLPPEDITFLQHTLAQELAQPGAISELFEIRIRCLDETSQETWRAMEAIAQNLSNTPPVNGIVISLRDVTQRRK